MAVQDGGRRGHNEEEETEAGNGDMNEEPVPVFRNLEMRTRLEVAAKKRKREDTRDMSIKSHSTCLVIGQSKETNQSKIYSSFSSFVLLGCSCYYF